MADTERTHGGKRAGAGRKPGPVSSDAERFIRARADKEEALARLREAEAGERERRLIPVEEVEQVVGMAFASVANAMQAIPDDLERSVGMAPEQAELVEQTINRALEGLADRLATLGCERGE